MKRQGIFVRQEWMDLLCAWIGEENTELGEMSIRARAFFFIERMAHYAEGIEWGKDVNELVFEDALFETIKQQLDADMNALREAGFIE